MSVAVSTSGHRTGTHRSLVVVAAVVAALAVLALMVGVWFTSASSDAPTAPAAPAVAEADCGTGRVVTAC